jgi:hypothetical protein
MCSECREYCSRDREREKDSLERFSEKALGYGLRHAAMFVLTGGVGMQCLQRVKS